MSAEGAGTVDALDGLGDLDVGDSSDVLGAMLLDGGVRAVHVLGYVHSHGNWLDWRASS